VAISITAFNIVQLAGAAGLVGCHILGGHDRADQVRAVFDPIVRLAQAELALDQAAESRTEFAEDSSLEGTGFELLVRGRGEAGLSRPFDAPAPGAWYGFEGCLSPRRRPAFAS